MFKFISPLILATGALLWSPPGRAQQVFLQAAPMTHLLPGLEDVTGAIPAAIVPDAVPPGANASASPLTGTVLRHLPNNAQGLRLAGEIGTSEWPVYLTQAQAAHPLKFQLGFLSAISDLPEASQLSVQINDRDIGQVSIDAPHKVKTIVFDVPSDVMKPGFNSLRIVARQRHRVDCSIQATYELWTQIDATQTGFLIQGADISVASLLDLPALPPGAQGAMPIRAVLPAATNTGSINRMMQLVQLVAIKGRFEQPLVDVADSLADGDGVNLVVASYEDIIKLRGMETLPPPAGPQLGFLPANAARRATVFVTGRTSGEADLALDRMAKTAIASGTPQGLRAAQAFPGYQVEGNTRLKLRDLGVISQEFNGRLFRASFNIVMPPDFYPANYGKIALELAGAYAPGLAAGAQIVVSVNDRIAVGSPLSKVSGEVFRGRLIDLPLGILRPGLNKVEIEAQLPMASDLACDPTGAATAKKRFLLLDDSEIVIPAIARVALTPNLAITATGGFPYAHTTLVSHLYIPGPDPDTIGAAATLIARMALSAGTLLDFKLSISPPSVSDGSTLVLGAASSLQPAALAMAGLDPEAVAKIWKTRATSADIAEKSQALSKYEALTQARIALQRNFPAECRMRPTHAKPVAPAVVKAAFTPMPPVLPAPQPKAEEDARTASLTDQWDRTVGAGRGWFGWIPWPAARPVSRAEAKPDATWSGTAYGWLGGWATTASNTVMSGFGGQVVSVVDDNAGLLVAQKNHGEAGEGIWTIVTAASSSALKEGVSCLVDPRVWSQLGGEIAALDTSEAKIRSVAASDARFINTQPLSFSNLRLISAGWFSLNSWLYVTTTIAIAIFLAGVTLAFVKSVGRRT